MAIPPGGGVVFNPKPVHHCIIDVPRPRAHGVYLCSCGAAYYVKKVEYGQAHWKKVKWFNRKANRILLDHGMKRSK